MKPDSPEDDRTVIRPPEPAAAPPAGAPAAVPTNALDAVDEDLFLPGADEPDLMLDVGGGIGTDGGKDGGKDAGKNPGNDSADLGHAGNDATVALVPGAKTSAAPSPTPVPAAPPPAAAADEGFQKTQWAATAMPAAAALADEKTQITGGPVRREEHLGGLAVGTRLNEFEITQFVAEGGFGLVYMAHDHSLQRRVALKEYMPSSLAARGGGSQVQVKSERHRETFEAGLKSFINEARLLASFDHPSLVKVYRFWEANGTAYMVMPFLEGTTLKDVLRNLGQRPDEGWLRTVLGPLTEALLVIHTQQCYHRDIAPDNVMLLPANASNQSRWLLLDFGAARRVIGDMTQALTVILKPDYAPVEQYAEIPGMKQGPWTDVYALAAVVYFAIIGKTPPPSVGRLLNDTYVPLTQSAAGRYSAQFLAAVDRALAVRPEERTQSIGELRNDLGLGEAGATGYTPTPVGRGASVDSSQEHIDPTMALLPGGHDETPQTVMAPRPVGLMPTRPALSPPPLSPVSPAATATPAAAQRPQASEPVAAASAKSGNSAMLGIGAGVLVLGGLGFAAYSFFTPSAEPPSSPVAAAPVAGPTPAPAVLAVPPAPVAAPTPAAVPTNFEPSQELARVVAAQTPGFEVRLATSKTSYRIGKDALSFSVQSERDGFVYVFVYGADKVLVQLLPNDTTRSLKVRKGETLKLPQGRETYTTTGPAGTTDLLVLVSSLPRDHSAMQPRKDGGFSVFPEGAAAAALAARIGGPVPPMAGKASCPATGNCDADFGAALVQLQVVP